MAKGALYWRLKDEKTGKWTYKKVQTYTQSIEWPTWTLKINLREEE
jgi:hypothetical protein